MEDPGPSNPNHAKIVWYIVTVLGAGLLTIVGAVYTNMSREIIQNKLDLKDLDKNVQKITAILSSIDQAFNDLKTLRESQQISREKIVSLETQASANKDNIERIRADLDYIKRRLDELFGKRLQSFPFHL